MWRAALKCDSAWQPLQRERLPILIQNLESMQDVVSRGREQVLHAIKAHDLGRGLVGIEELAGRALGRHAVANAGQYRLKLLALSEGVLSRSDRFLIQPRIVSSGVFCSGARTAQCPHEQAGEGAAHDSKGEARQVGPIP